MISRLQAELDETGSKARLLEEKIGSLEDEHSQRKAELGRLEDHAAQARTRYAEAAERRARLTAERESLRKRRERVEGHLEPSDVLDEEALERTFAD